MNPEQVVALLLVIADNRLIMDAQARRIGELEAELAQVRDERVST